MFLPTKLDSYLLDFSVPYKKMTQCIAGMHFCAFQRHYNVSILLAVLRWPVLVTFPLKGTFNFI